ncbi:aspartyl-trna synthetase [Rhodobacteraceae bacterium 2376]|uniref:Aspartyl-trna synthetase n=1 Tax=Rhabdonatronobacter sediminivivens TaxID=2743469 RepID=A0A7Z0HZ56_9RHOB|nr:SH3 domain-containing protein [Rhabdonatronobacter sediminivivens]NYS24707.1 aspartyl-trna synthetase [Rhabdonatronobacter sediminivivens]
MKHILRAAVMAVLIWAQPMAALAAELRGPVTNLPMPRFVSLKASEANARRGPSTAHRIDWVYRLRDMPLRVTAEYEHWRRVEDAEGKGGWMHYALLSGVRTALVTEAMTALRSHPTPEGRTMAYLEAGVVARLTQCEPDWCRLQVEGNRGWAPKSALWGVEAAEVFD